MHKQEFIEWLESRDPTDLLEAFLKDNNLQIQFDQWAEIMYQDECISYTDAQEDR